MAQLIYMFVRLLTSMAIALLLLPVTLVIAFFYGLVELLRDGLVVEAEKQKELEAAAELTRARMKAEGQLDPILMNRVRHNGIGVTYGPKHWSDKEILYSGDFGKGAYIAYDEAGLELGRYNSMNEARQALIAYGDYLKSGL